MTSLPDRLTKTWMLALSLVAGATFFGCRTARPSASAPAADGGAGAAPEFAGKVFVAPVLACEAAWAWLGSAGSIPTPGAMCSLQLAFARGASPDEVVATIADEVEIRGRFRPAAGVSTPGAVELVFPHLGRNDELPERVVYMPAEYRLTSTLGVFWLTGSAAATQALQGAAQDAAAASVVTSVYRLRSFGAPTAGVDGATFEQRYSRGGTWYVRTLAFKGFDVRLVHENGLAFKGKYVRKAGASDIVVQIERHPAVHYKLLGTGTGRRLEPLAAADVNPTGDVSPQQGAVGAVSGAAIPGAATLVGWTELCGDVAASAEGGGASGLRLHAEDSDYPLTFKTHKALQAEIRKLAPGAVCVRVQAGKRQSGAALDVLQHRKP